jgi:hypothetical protein
MGSACEFYSEMSLDDMLKVLNRKGPWKWSMHDSFWCGDYLVCRPEQGVRVRIHYPAESVAPNRQHPKGYYTGTFSVDTGAAATPDSIDRIFRKLLTQLHAQKVREIEYYD